MWVGVLLSIWAGVSAPAFAGADHVLPPIFTDPAFGKLLRHDPYAAETASRIIGVQNADWSDHRICSALLKDSGIAPADHYLELLTRLRRPEMLGFAREWALRLQAHLRKGPYRSLDTQIDLSTGSSVISFTHRRTDGDDAPLQFRVHGRNVWKGEAQPISMVYKTFNPAAADHARKNTLKVETPAAPGAEEAVPITFLDGKIKGFGNFPAVDPGTFPSGDDPSTERDQALEALKTITDNFRRFLEAATDPNAITMPTFFTFFARTTEAIERLSQLTDNFQQKPWIRELIDDILSGTPEPADLKQYFPVNKNAAHQLLTEGVEVYIGLREKLSELHAN